MSSPSLESSAGFRIAVGRLGRPEHLGVVVQLVGPHQEHGPDTAVQHASRYAAEDDSPEARAPVRRHDDEVYLRPSCVGDDSLGRVTKLTILFTSTPLFPPGS